MKRREILDLFEDDQHETIKEVIDYFEGEFKAIQELLTIGSVDNLDQVSEAKYKAEQIADDLY